jgi:hypothetical protein
MPKYKFKNSNTASTVPSSLVAGEVAFNLSDGRGWQGNSAASVTKIIDTVGKQAANNVAITGGSLAVTSVGATAQAAAVATSTTIGGTALANISSDPRSVATNAVLTNYAAQNLAVEAGSKLKNVFTYTGGTNTYTKSGDDVRIIHVIVCGGGGGGRAYAESGGAGGYAERVIDATGITTVTVTVGGGGAGGAYFGFSPGGSTTSFGGFVSAPGGGGANAHIQHNGGLGGLGSGGQLNVWGGGGGGHNNQDQYNGNGAPGHGGVSFFGGSQPSGHGGQQPSDVAAWGSGGVATNPAHNGQGGRNGKGGICIVYEYK